MSQYLFLLPFDSIKLTTPIAINGQNVLAKAIFFNLTDDFLITVRAQIMQWLSGTHTHQHNRS